jgi:hypothetical protein
VHASWLETTVISLSLEVLVRNEQSRGTNLIWSNVFLKITGFGKKDTKFLLQIVA